MKISNLKRLAKKDGKISAIILLVILAIVIAAVLIFTGVIKINFGEGGFGGFFPANNTAEGSEGGTADTTEAEQQSNTVIIKIDGSDIYFDDVLCADETELKNKITETGTKKEYELVHDTAIKATYDKVIAMLYELEEALEIKIDYNT